MELARSALRAGVTRFVYASTTLIYGAGHDRPAVEADEPDPPGSAYPTSKAAAERVLLHLYQAEGLPLRIARLAFVYGEGDPHLAESVMWARDWPLHRRPHLVHHADVGPAAGEAASRTLDDPWQGIADTAKIRRELGFRPIYPTVYAARDAGAF